MSKSIFILIGTRPNFIKITRFKELASNAGKEVTIIHTGQHFDHNMANVFFEQFELEPDYFLEVGGLSPASQIGHIIIKLEELFDKIGKPDYLVVPGDVNSTFAGAIAANKTGVTLVHLESGLRSRDKKMPEEHNRILTDYMADICFVTESSGIKNLKAEEANSEIHLVGNTMIDTLIHFEPKIDQSRILEDLRIKEKQYILATFHRPSNVDRVQKLQQLVNIIIGIAEYQTLVIPMHPRTMKMLTKYDLMKKLKHSNNVIITEPLGYFEFQKLIKHSTAVITDSGGIQEETTFRQVPCLTIRENTERPITITEGSNTLVQFNMTDINFYLTQIIKGTYKKGSIPVFWDGKATKRILEIL
ncbi:MAG: non-hydrolyzing UDP-N-acetylglucosamine 2-epimerase [Crocinitomicaceae bacterium]